MRRVRGARETKTSDDTRRPEKSAARIRTARINRTVLSAKMPLSNLLQRYGFTPIELSWVSISGGSCNVAALRLSRRCVTEDVPGISRMLGER